MIACPRCGHPNSEGARYCSNCALELTAVASQGEVRKTVTVMFMDAAGSTGLGEQADPEALRRVMSRYFDEIRSIVERHGGTVEKYIGDAVMAVFGVPVVHEDDALRALRAAAEIRGRLIGVDAELLRERGLTVHWRTGINTGEVVAGDARGGQRFVSGDAVNVAARLEQASQAGDILIGSDTFDLVRDFAVAESVGPLALKGKAGPIAAYRLLEVATGLGGGPRRPDSPMVGRQRHRRLLAEAFDQAVTERVCFLFTILGAAGVGKSRLITEFLADTGEQALVLHGRCLSYGDGITFWPIAEAVREAGQIDDDDDDAAVRAKLGALVDDESNRAQVVERMAGLLGRNAPASAAEETTWAIRTLLESLARRRPVTLVLDDLHWAEPALMDLIDHLAEWVHDAPLMLVCIARQDLLDLRPGWGGGRGNAATLTLEPLNEVESRELMANLLGRSGVSGALETSVSAAAEGNPLFVEEMVGMLIDKGHLVRTDGGWVAADDLTAVAVPPTIHALLEARLDGLPAPEREVLERAAIEGKVFHRGAVVELSPKDSRNGVPQALRSLSRKDLVRADKPDFSDDEAFRFRHLLIRDAAYAGLPKERRAELHARFAAWLERVASEHIAEYDEILGYHYEQAHRYRTELGPADEEARRLAAQAAQHLGAAGQRALDRSDLSAARKLLIGAAQLLPPGAPQRTRLRADLAMAMAQSGEFEAAQKELAQTIKEAADGDSGASAYAELVLLDVSGSLSIRTTEQLVERGTELRSILELRGDRRGADKATYDLARYHFFAGRGKAAESMLLEAIAKQPAGERVGQFSFWLPPILLWGPTPVAEAVKRVEALLLRSDNRSAEALALASLGLLRSYQGAPAEGRDHVARAVAISHELGMRTVAVSMEGNFGGGIELLTGNYHAAESMLHNAYAVLTETGERGFAATVAGNIAGLYATTGRYEEAEPYAHAARDLAPPDDIDAQARGARAQALVLASRGEFSDALILARMAVAIVDPTDYLELRGQTYRDLGEVLVKSGDLATANIAFEQAQMNFATKGISMEVERTARRRIEISSPRA